MVEIERLNNIRFDSLLGGKNASAVCLLPDRALVVADELTDDGRNVVQVFERHGDVYHAIPDENVSLDPSGATNQEMDLEGIAAEGTAIYVLGSHSARRKRVDEKHRYAKNRNALLAPAELEPSRDVLVRYTLGAGGKAGPIERTSLRAFLDANEPFRSFRSVASKENGIDAEGLAVRGEWLYIGFRGPVLRGNFAPVVRCRFGQPIKDPEVLFVGLGGRGIRDLTAVDDGLLILAGPVGDGPGTYQLYFWDGEDTVTGEDVRARSAGLSLLGDLPLPDIEGAVAKAEGLALVEERSGHWKVLVVFDGLKNGHAMRYRINKPG
jgi:hypothetical protein